MRKVKLLVMAIMMTTLLSGSVQAGLWDPPLLNQSFELPDVGGGWGQNADDWFDNDYWGTFIESELGGGIPDTPYGGQWGGVTGDGILVQQIGTYDSGASYVITILHGQRANNNYGAIDVNLWGGGDASQLVDTNDLGTWVSLTTIGATQLDTVTMEPPSFVGNTTELTEEMTATLEAAAGLTGGVPLFLQIVDNGGKSWFDIVTFESGSPINLISPVGAENTGWDLTLEWSVTPPFTTPGYNIYMDPNMNKVAARDPSVKENIALDTDPNWDVTGLTHGETYYWMVEARVDPVTTPPTDPNWVPSSVASFSTLPDTVLIGTHPVSQTVPETTEVTFTVTSPNADTYKWYKADTPYEGDVGTEVLGGNTDTLTLTNVGIVQEGYYYCEVANAAPSEKDSNRARLMIERLVSHWEFENDMTDSGEDWDGVYVDPNDLNPPPTPSYPPGIADLAFEFPLDGKYILIPDSNDYFNFYPQGYTVSGWAKTTKTSSWGAIAAKQDTENNYLGWVLNINGNSGVSTLREQSVGNFWPDYGGSTVVTDGEWHMITGQYDAVDRVVRCYIDGELENTSGQAPEVISPNLNPLIFGVESRGGGVDFEGLVDDIKIWNYPLSRVDVALQYIDKVPGATICAEDLENIEFDFNGDCIQDIKDLSLLASKWLECYLVPTCIQ